MTQNESMTVSPTWTWSRRLEPRQGLLGLFLRHRDVPQRHPHEPGPGFYIIANYG
jgi:hypothetical protein